MKKIGSLIFISALSIGVAFSTNCSFGSISNLSGVQGSGTSKTETRSVKGFTKIDASGAVSVEVSVGGSFSVEVSADDNLLANIKTEASGDTLKIYSADRISPKTPISIRVSMPKIENFEVSGASSGIVSSVKADALELKASGASKIRIEGATDDLKAEISGASTLEADNLKAENAEVEASGASKAMISVNNDLDADASGASRITYTGEPKNLKQNSSGASSITKK